MPQSDFGEEDNIPGTGGRFVSLQEQGEKITFRLAGRPVYRGQHWLEDDREFQPCAKVNSGGEKECPYCEAGLKPSIKYSFPIVNRELKQPQIFETAMSVKQAIDENANAGVNIYKADWVVTRNEGSPANYYGVVRVDPVPLDDAEKRALKEASGWDLEGMLSKSFPDQEIDNDQIIEVLEAQETE